MTSPIPFNQLSAFTTDTLYPSVGGEFPISRKNPAKAPQINGKSALAVTSPQQQVTFYGPLDDHSVAHEAGHIADMRGKFPPEVTAALMRGRAESHNPNNYAWSDDDEYIAEAFARAMDSARHQFSDSTKAEHDMPGVLSLVHWLQQQKPFSK